MKRSPEWLEEYERKRIARIGAGNHDAWKAREAARWNGNESTTAGGAIRKDAHSDGGMPGSPAVRSLSAPATHLYPLVNLCRGAGLPEPVPEYTFAKPRRWRFDYAWPLVKLALEVDGGVWTQGRHTRGAGKIADMEKLSEAAILGWRVLYAVPDDLRNGVALGRVMRALGVAA